MNLIGAVVKCKNSQYAKEHQKFFEVKTVVYYTDTSTYGISLRSLAGDHTPDRFHNVYSMTGRIPWHETFLDGYSIHDGSKIRNEPIMQEKFHKGYENKFNINDIVELDGKYYVVIDEKTDRHGFRDLSSGLIMPPHAKFSIEYGATKVQ